MLEPSDDRGERVVDLRRHVGGREEETAEEARNRVPDAETHVSVRDEDDESDDGDDWNRDGHSCLTSFRACSCGWGFCRYAIPSGESSGHVRCTSGSPVRCSALG